MLLARRAERLGALSAELRERYGVPIHTIALDVRDLERVQQLPEELPPEFKEVSILVNNAGGCWTAEGKVAGG